MKKARNLFRPSLSMRNAGGCEKKMPAYGRFWRNTISLSHSSNLRTGLESNVPKSCHQRRGKNERRRESRYFEAFSAGEKMSMRDGGRVRMAGSGYSPASEKDWKAINRSRPEDRKKVDQKTRKFYPLTDTVIENHLLGTETIGVYSSHQPPHRR